MILQMSRVAFATTESAHIIGLALVGGVVLIADFAVLGWVLRQTSAATVVRQLRALYLGALILVAVSGVLLVASGPYKYFSNPLFPVKLALLAIALIVHWQLVRRIRRRESADRAARSLAAASLLLWTGVVIAGRWLGLI